MHERISFIGLLRGDGGQAECTVSAIKVSLPGTTDYELTQYSIMRVSKPLPEGKYQLSAHGKTIDITHHNGDWLAV
jgi:hypothetical protein